MISVKHLVAIEFEPCLQGHTAFAMLGKGLNDITN